jgi:hypothetical protein
MKEDWEMADQTERGQRLSQLALRVAAITSAANSDSEVTPTCMKAALKLMEWQQELREVFKPSQGDSMGGKYSEMIMNEAWRHVDANGDFVPFPWREVSRRNHWYAKDGIVVAKQLDNLLKEGYIIEVEHPKKRLYRASQWSREKKVPKDIS